MYRNVNIICCNNLLDDEKVDNFLTTIHKSFKLNLSSHGNETAILNKMPTSSSITPGTI